jgi:rod shape-determining protein MreB
LNFVPEIGIDLGTSNIRVFKRGKGIVMDEPTVVAINTQNKKVLGIGRGAREMIGRTPGNILAVRPLKEGVIADYTVTYRMLEEIRRKTVGPHQLWIKPTALISVPSGVTNVERRAVLKAAHAAGFGKVMTIEEPMAAAVGAGLPIDTAGGNMIVDIGGGTTDIAVISLGGIVHSEGIRIGGAKMDQAIIKHIRNTYSLQIGDQSAEDLKMEIGTAFPMDQEKTAKIRGRDLVGGLPKTIDVTSTEVREALGEPIRQIAERLCLVLEETPPELSADIIERGVYLTGGGSLLRGLDKLLEGVTEIRCMVADNATNAVAVGTGRALENLDKIYAAGAVSNL